MKIKDIPKTREFERLRNENPKEYRRIYHDSMKCLDKATRRVSIAAIIIGLVSILLSLIRALTYN